MPTKSGLTGMRTANRNAVWAGMDTLNPANGDTGLDPVLYGTVADPVATTENPVNPGVGLPCNDVVDDNSSNGRTAERPPLKLVLMSTVMFVSTTGDGLELASTNVVNWASTNQPGAPLTTRSEVAVVGAGVVPLVEFVLLLPNGDSRGGLG